MNEINLAKIQKKLKKELDEDRYRHTLGVMYTAASLAMCYGADLFKAQLAGLLHDCAKCIPTEKKLKLCRSYNVQISRAEERAPYLLHAKLGAVLAREVYGVSDPEVLNAITWHTTGRAEMTLLEKIVFEADYIEPHRTKASNLSEIRQVSFEDLDRAVYMTLRDTLSYLDDRNANIDNTTREAYAYYDDLIRRRCRNDDSEGIAE